MKKIIHKKILFLGYNHTQSALIDVLKNIGCDVEHSSDFVNYEGKDLIISFGYKKLIKKDIINSTRCPIINLHISYLPYNKGSHPNFWSFYDETPSGVTIHLIDQGLDTGPIIFQRYIKFNSRNYTFKETYKILKKEIEDLFITNLEDILNYNWEPKDQIGKGSFHKKSELPKSFKGWDTIIFREIKRLKELCNKNE